MLGSHRQHTARFAPCSHPVKGGEGTSPRRWEAMVPMPDARGRSRWGTAHTLQAGAAQRQTAQGGA